MNYLIDTHTFLWFSEGSPELSRQAKDIIAHEENQIFISIASLWEISIKTSLKKLTVVGGYESVLDDVTTNSIELMPITFRHTVIQNTLPFYHRDPFDRIIAAQAIVERMSLVSRDKVFDNYFDQEAVRRIWQSKKEILFNAICPGRIFKSMKILPGQIALSLGNY